MNGIYSCHLLCAIVLLAVIGHMIQTGQITAHLCHVISCGQSQLYTLNEPISNHSVQKKMIAFTSIKDVKTII
ncbi:unnamed protein product, partial [Staurois parvus]